MVSLKVVGSSTYLPKSVYVVLVIKIVRFTMINESRVSSTQLAMSVVQGCIPIRHS